MPLFLLSRWRWLWYKWVVENISCRLGLIPARGPLWERTVGTVALLNKEFQLIYVAPPSLRHYLFHCDRSLLRSCKACSQPDLLLARGVSLCILPRASSWWVVILSLQVVLLSAYIIVAQQFSQFIAIQPVSSIVDING
jgi:hypothetical protein